MITKGPWTVSDWSENHYTIYGVHSGMPQPVAVAFDVTSEEDARLISAAPDLLEACQALLNHSNARDLNLAYRLAEIAVAKAKGVIK